MQPKGIQLLIYRVVISFQFSTFVSLMQRKAFFELEGAVVISFQFSTFVSLMQLSGGLS